VKEFPSSSRVCSNVSCPTGGAEPVKSLLLKSSRIRVVREL